jgi:hypothetical protein
MTALETKAAGHQTLAERLSEGTIPAEQMLRYAGLLGEALRKIHDTGKSHGAISPETISITAEGLELALPAETAGPEDIPADIFAFGTVLAEMQSIANRPLGDPLAEDPANLGIGPLIAACVARNPADRLPSMQKALLELKLAALSARHSSARAANRGDSDTAMRTEIQRSQVRQEALLKEHEVCMAAKHQATSDALDSMHAEIEAMEEKWAHLRWGVETNASRLGELENTAKSAVRQLETRQDEAVRRMEQEIETQTAVLEALRRSMAQTDDLIGRVVETVEAKLAAAQRIADESGRRIDVLERCLKAAADQNARIEARVADDMRQVQTELEARAAAVESLRKSVAQTDDMVGRVVEAVESILDLSPVRT